MKTLKSNKTLLAAAVGAALALGMASNVYASPVFTVDPSALGSTELPFQADFFGGLSSELLHGDATAGTLTANSGWLNLTGVSLAGNPILPGNSGLGVDYQLYVTYDLVATLVSGTFGAINSVYNLTSLNFSFWGDTGLDTTFTQADAASATEATVTTGALDTLLGGGSLISGVAGFDNLFGAYFNSFTTYTNTTAGSAFFTAPVPFYNVGFEAFNNTTQGVKKVGDCNPLCDISITNAVGGVDFNQIPEPATLALMGLGLLGLGVLRKNKAG